MNQSRKRIGAVWAASVISLTPFTTGHFKTNYKHMVAGGESRAVNIPIPFYVLRHPQGIILFDSGLGLEFPEQVKGWFLHRLFQFLLPTSFKREDAAVAQLAEQGIEPEDVRYIIVSHLHYDHAGGLRDFPKATIVVSKKEWEHFHVNRWKARLRGAMAEQLEEIEDRLQLIDYKNGKPYGPFKSSVDLFQDGSLILLSTPGHTPGHESLLVMLKGQKILLTGDAVWVRENYERPAPKSWFIRHFEEDESQAWKTTQAIHEFSKSNPDVLIIPGHEPIK